MFHLKESINRRSQILAEMAKIDRIRRGSLSKQYFKTVEKGHKITRGPYYVLQCSLNGKNCCERVAAKDVALVEGSVVGYERFRQLAKEFIEITEEMTLAAEGDVDSKKNGRRSSRVATRKPRRS